MQAVMQTRLTEDINRYFDAVIEDKEELIVTRENGTSVVVIDLDEYNSLLETFRVYKDPYPVEVLSNLTGRYNQITDEEDIDLSEIYKDREKIDERNLSFN